MLSRIPSFEQFEQSSLVSCSPAILINKRIVNSSGFTQKENGAVVMDDDIRKVFLSNWQAKKQEKITHPFLEEKIEWGMVPHAQAMLLARFIRGDLDEYPPFMWK